MKVRTRFIRSVIETAQTCDAELPWARGAVRRKMIANRRCPPIRLVHSA